MNISIIGGRVIDPASNTDTTLNLHIKDETLIAIGDAPNGFSADQTIDATGKIVCPGLVDMAAHLLEPGHTAKGTLASETLAAAKGGITTLICTPDTEPCIDSPADIEFIHRMARPHSVAQHAVSLLALAEKL